MCWINAGQRQPPPHQARTERWMQNSVIPSHNETVELETASTRAHINTFLHLFKFHHFTTIQMHLTRHVESPFANWFNQITVNTSHHIHTYACTHTHRESQCLSPSFQSFMRNAMLPCKYTSDIFFQSEQKYTKRLLKPYDIFVWVLLKLTAMLTMPARSKTHDCDHSSLIHLCIISYIIDTL